MTARRKWLGVTQMVVSLGIIGWLLHRVGIAPVFAAIQSLSAGLVVGALAIGAVAAVIQAERWRLVARGFNMTLSRGDAVAKCWQAAFLNSVLPGGLAGDAIRAVEQRTSEQGTWRAGIGSVLGERLAGTAVMLAAAAIALMPRVPWLGAAVGVTALVIIGVAWPSLRNVPPRARWGVLGLAGAGWLVFAALFLVATISTTTGTTGSLVARVGVFDVLALAAVTLAGMSIPLNWGGWGPREGAAALVFPLFGSSAEVGVAVAFTYGILALVSVLPGAAILITRGVGAGRRAAETEPQTPGGAESAPGAPSGTRTHDPRIKSPLL